MKRGAVEEFVRSQGVTKDNAQMVNAPINVGTYIEDGDGAEVKVSETIERPLPMSLGDAVAIYGEKDVFTIFAKAKVIEIQGSERSGVEERALQARGITRASQPGKERKKAAFMDALNLD